VAASRAIEGREAGGDEHLLPNGLDRRGRRIDCCWQRPAAQHVFEPLRHLRARALVLVLEVIPAWPRYVAAQGHKGTLALGTAPYQASHDQRLHILAALMLPKVLPDLL
jgi:hypothetical protein